MVKNKLQTMFSKFQCSFSLKPFQNLQKLTRDKQHLKTS